jgi:hypothetical protein
LQLELVLKLAHGELSHIAFFQCQTAMVACCNAVCTFCASN